jgi:hypothetical protein
VCVSVCVCVSITMYVCASFVLFSEQRGLRGLRVSITFLGLALGECGRACRTTSMIQKIIYSGQWCFVFFIGPFFFYFSEKDGEGRTIFGGMTWHVRHAFTHGGG